MEANSPKSLSRGQERRLLDVATAMARRDFESPEREGCPNKGVLRKLAQRDRSLDKEIELIDHVGTCSPCFAEYSEFRSSYKVRRQLQYLCAAVVVLAACLAFWSLRANFGFSTSNPQIAASPQGNPITLVLDLRAKTIPRGPASDPAADESIRLKRARMLLTIRLPVGSEDGNYDVALVDTSGRVVRQARGTATLETFIEVLPVSLDLTGLSNGKYILRYRRGQAPWSEYVVQLD